MSENTVLDRIGFRVTIVNAFNICVLTFYSCCKFNMDLDAKEKDILQ